MSEQEFAGKAKGGHARALALSPEKRKEIAQKAAAARHDRTSGVQTATHEGPLWIGDLEIPAAVLPDKTRLLLSKAFLTALGRPWKGTYKRTERPNFIEAANLSEFINKDLEDVLTPIEYRNKRGQKVIGYNAKLLPEVIDVYLKARAKGVLKGRQREIADQAELIGRGLMRMGIIGLVDEATGYQEVRDKDALQAILDQFLRKSLAAWAKKFPDEFYWHIFRLRGWEWKGRKVNPPQIVAYYTNDFVYHRLAPNLVEELDKRNPIVNGRRKAKNTQWLTEDVGDPALAAHLQAVIGFMRVSKTWDQLRSMLDEAFPKQSATVQLPLFSEPLPLLEKAIAPIETLPLFGQSHDASPES